MYRNWNWTPSLCDLPKLKCVFLLRNQIAVHTCIWNLFALFHFFSSVWYPLSTKEHLLCLISLFCSPHKVYLLALNEWHLLRCEKCCNQPPSSLKSIEKRNAWWIQCTLHIMCPSLKNIHSASCIHFKPLMNVPLQLNSIGGKIGHAFPQLKSRKTRALLSAKLTWQF